MSVPRITGARLPNRRHQHQRPCAAPRSQAGHRRARLACRRHHYELEPRPSLLHRIPDSPETIPVNLRML